MHLSSYQAHHMLVYHISSHLLGNHSGFCATKTWAWANPMEISGDELANKCIICPPLTRQQASLLYIALCKPDILFNIMKGSWSEQSHVQYLVKRYMEYAMLDMLWQCRTTSCSWFSQCSSSESTSKVRSRSSCPSFVMVVWSWPPQHTGP